MNILELKPALLERFLRCAEQDTQSNPEKADAGVMPSTETQRFFALIQNRLIFSFLKRRRSLKSTLMPARSPTAILWQQPIIELPLACLLAGSSTLFSYFLFAFHLRRRNKSK